MVREIEAGNVGTVIVKDMSRFGRNYLQVGFYTEIMFPDKGVRFIAVNNSIDSAKPQENDFTPFLNIMNEFYSRDTSNKIKAIFRARMQDGKRCSGSVPYGYVRSPSDKQTLVVDPEAAQVVRQIFDLACQGMGPAKIADFLCESQVLIPSAYQRLHHPEYCRNDYRNPYRWSGNTVNTILSRREYLGETILGKSVCENFKTKKRRAATPEEQLVFPNTHEAIIDQETWDTAHQMRKRAPRRRPNGSDSHRLSGLVYCADCGARLSYHDCTASRCRDTTYDSDLGFQCSHYGNLHHDCTSHYIKASVLEAIILRAVQSVTHFAKEHEAEFLKTVQAAWEERYAQSLAAEKQELATATHRLAELDNLIRGLFEGSVTGVMPERQIQRLSKAYDEEQTALEKRIAELEASLAEIPDVKQNEARFLALVRKYEDITEVTNEMLYAFVEKILVHAPTGGRSAKRRQQIDVYFSFIGTFVPPGVEEEEEAKRAEQEQQRAERRRATQQRSAQRRKERLAALREAAKTDAAAAAEYEAYRVQYRAYGKNYRERRRARERSSDMHEQQFGRYGRMHLQYLKQDRPVLYIAMVMDGNLWPYLEELNNQAQKRMERLTSQMAAREGVTEALKAEDPMAWVGKMENIRSRAEEILLRELIYR